MPDEGTAVWRWVAAIVVAAMLAGAPGYINVVRSPSRDDLAEISDRQQIVLQRLAAIDAQIADDNVERDDLQDLIVQIQRDLSGHIVGHRP